MVLGFGGDAGAVVLDLDADPGRRAWREVRMRELAAVVHRLGGVWIRFVQTCWSWEGMQRMRREIAVFLDELDVA